MLSSTRSAAPRALRCRSIQTCRQGPRHVRLQSTSASSSTSSASQSHLATGVAGGVVGALLFYGIYSFTPAGRTASTINKAAVEANKQYKAAAAKLQQATPEPDQAISYIKDLAYSYVGWVPGGRGFVDAAFKDVEVVREKHKDEVNNIIADGYRQFQELSKAGLSMQTATRAYETLADLAKKLADLSNDALSDIVDNHPQVKEKLGGNLDKLKALGEEYGPDAKKQVDETWHQVKDVFAGGLSAANVAKAKTLIDDKVGQLQKLGDEAWSKGLDAAKPYLDKNPKAKELIERNADALKQGNVKELFDKARAAVDSGDLGDLEKYVKGAADRAASKGKEVAGDWGLDKYLKALPDGGEVLSKLQQISKVAGEHRKDGEKLLSETVEELKKVLEKKASEAQDLVDSAEKEASSDSKDGKESNDDKKGSEGKGSKDGKDSGKGAEKESKDGKKK
ncbi:hypothetical protein ISF_04729 [Cordyceps fumosorosea ARSEF 2679]|uniref:Apolipoprotein/apolipophorin n=1 Tax=Cordyceps fumosorosea (strain ARSEF 2679) TaxID=1081104 RepID=A0A162MM49_CORFA|nr:hypothetical protein ISF_04729 [Cordyceps fumosorosea ARSEF 2679]OAA64020.1 hypothetical protein ISF_04729 [Cordyceps fumosorosea ARSEF 2679]